MLILLYSSAEDATNFFPESSAAVLYFLLSERDRRRKFIGMAHTLSIEIL